MRYITSSGTVSHAKLQYRSNSLGSDSSPLRDGDKAKLCATSSREENTHTYNDTIAGSLAIAGSLLIPPDGLSEFRGGARCEMIPARDSGYPKGDTPRPRFRGDRED